MKLLINDLNEIKRRLTFEKLSLYPLVLSFTLATSRILNVFMSTVRGRNRIAVHGATINTRLTWYHSPTRL